MRRRGRVTIRAAVARATAAMATLAALVAGGGCSRPPEPPPELVLYAAADAEAARAVVAAFEAAHDLRVRLVVAGAGGGGVELADRLRAERDAPKADVLWTREVFTAIALAEEGLLAPSSPAAAAARSAATRDAEGRWHGFAAHARVVAYDPERLAAEELPVAWSDLAQDRWAGRLVMDDPRLGSPGGHLGAMKAWWDRELMRGFYDAWLLGLRDVGVRMLPEGPGAAVAAVVAGEADLAMTDSDHVWRADAAGDRVAMLPLPHAKDPGDGHGTLLVPAAAGLVADGPEPEAALVLMEFLLSPEAERILAESDARRIPLHPELAGAYPDLEVPDPLGVELVRAAATRAAAVDRARRVVLGPAEGRDWPDAVPPAGGRRGPAASEPSAADGPEAPADGPPGV